MCPNNTRNPHNARKCPDRVRAAIREDTITAAIASFLDDFVLGYDRAAMLTKLLPASAADEAALQAQLDAITGKAASDNDPGLITELPYAPGCLATAPDSVREALYAALGIQCSTGRPLSRPPSAPP